jgi:hypothetical protein
MSPAPRIGLVVLAVAAVVVASAPAATRHRAQHLRVVALPPPPLADARLVSEPHIAVTPGRPRVLVAVAQTNRAVVAWRSTDGGRRWTVGTPLRGVDGTDGYAGGDPVIALDRGGLAALAAVALDRRGRCTLLNRTGSYRSLNGGQSFQRMQPPMPPAALPRHFFGVPPLPQCPIPPGLTHVVTIDKPWVAIDATHGRFAGSAYLTWSRNDQHLDGSVFTTLFLARSRDGGRTYSKPVAIAPRAQRPPEIEHYSQVAVRPDGTVDVVWNDLWDGKPAVVHAASHDGGVTFSATRPVVVLAGRTPLGLTSSLAVSPSGSLAVCWSGSTRLRAFRPRMACSRSDNGRSWSRPVAPFGRRGDQYLPAATFQGRRLWVAGYRSTRGSTRVLLARARRDGGFAGAVTLAARPYGRTALCGPHPPDCTPRQRFVGDYIGATATRRHVWVDFVLPTGSAASDNRVYVARLTP